MARYKKFSGNPAKFESHNEKVGGKDGCGSMYGSDGGHGVRLPTKIDSVPEDGVTGSKVVSDKELIQLTTGDARDGGPTW